MDMRLLSVFEEVFKTRSVSRTAENLDIPQTSVSLALGRLRRQFNDPLFVRTAQGMIPTPHAAELLQPLRQALELLRQATQQQIVFEPSTSTRHFHISMTDVSHIEFLPRLIRRTAELAPLVRIEVLRIATDTPERLTAGDADLAVGYMPELEAGFYQQRLFEQGFSCVVAHDHPRVKSRMSAALFKSERHVEITAPGTGNELVELELRRIGVQRNIALSLHTLPGLGNLLAETELVATVPERVGQTLTRIAKVKLLETPFKLPVFAIKQHWHERFHQDPANCWLRSLIAQLYIPETYGRRPMPATQRRSNGRLVSV